MSANTYQLSVIQDKIFLRCLITEIGVTSYDKRKMAPNRNNCDKQEKNTSKMHALPQFTTPYPHPTLSLEDLASLLKLASQV